MDTKYMMATKAMHKTGDISRDKPDLCVVYNEDSENYIGNWVVGYGFLDVSFPKVTTRDLTPEEVEKYHGTPISVGSNMLYFINLTGETVGKSVRLIKVGGDVFVGVLESPLKVGRFLYITDYSTGKFIKTSTIQSINGNEIKTRNSTYTIEYV